MGVSYYSCDCCGDSRYEEYVGDCGKCGHSLGTCCVVNDDIRSDYAYEYNVLYDGTEEQRKAFGIEDDWEEKGWVTIGEPIDDSGIDPKYCPFCQGEKVSREDLFDYLIKKLGVDYEELKREYLANKLKSEG